VDGWGAARSRQRFSCQPRLLRISRTLRVFSACTASRGGRSCCASLRRRINACNSRRRHIYCLRMYALQRLRYHSRAPLNGTRALRRIRTRHAACVLRASHQKRRTMERRRTILLHWLAKRIITYDAIDVFNARTVAPSPFPACAWAYGAAAWAECRRISAPHRVGDRDNQSAGCTHFVCHAAFSSAFHRIERGCSSSRRLACSRGVAACISFIYAQKTFFSSSYLRLSSCAPGGA